MTDQSLLSVVAFFYLALLLIGFVLVFAPSKRKKR
jgi:hypothetical protein